MLYVTPAAPVPDVQAGGLRIWLCSLLASMGLSRLLGCSHAWCVCLLTVPMPLLRPEQRPRCTSVQRGLQSGKLVPSGTEGVEALHGGGVACAHGDHVLMVTPAPAASPVSSGTRCVSVSVLLGVGLKVRSADEAAAASAE